MAKPKRPPKPTQFQAKILRMIAQSPLVKTYSADHKAVWALMNGREVSEICAQALIRNGWVRAQNDGLPGIGDSQVYVARTPTGWAINPAAEEVA
jgi:hypothetical protein